MRKPWRITALLLVVLTVLAGGFLGDDLLAVSDEARQGFEEFTELAETVKERYGGEVSYRDLVFASVQGMLRTLDPHTSFLSPEAYERMQDRQQSSFYGLGILVGTRNGQLTVIAPLEGTPASRMGMRAGDVISTIEGEPTDTMELDDAVSKLKGPKGTEVTINVVRPGVSTPLEMTITRAEIPLTSVRYVFMIAPDTGYLRITDFNRSTGREVADAIATLEDQGMERLLVDLRNNGGGLLDQAIEVADQFVPKGTLVVETKGRIRGSFEEYRAEGDDEPLELPLVVLVNEGSASAAEILAGAIQDHDVGIIVGTPSWGKGLVQTVYRLPYDAALALTTAQYYTPSGRLIQRDYSSYYDYYYQRFDHNLPQADPEPVEPEMPSAEEPVYKTDLGREVRGGGGITPDVVIESEPPPEMLQFLVARNAFFRFAVTYTDDHEIDSRDWQPDDLVAQRFRNWLVEEDLGSREEIDELFADEETRDEAMLRLRAEVFNASFGNDAWYRVLAEADEQIEAALGAFDDAASLLQRRQALDRPPASGVDDEQVAEQADVESPSG